MKSTHEQPTSHIGISLFCFYGIYILLLRKNTFFNLNRIYLILTSGLSFLIPYLNIIIQGGGESEVFVVRSQYGESIAKEKTKAIQKQIEEKLKFSGAKHLGVPVRFSKSLYIEL